MLSKTEVVTDAQMTRYSKSLERKNLKKHGKSLSFSGIVRAANPFIVEIRSDAGAIVIRHGWREAMRSAAEAKL